MSQPLTFNSEKLAADGASAPAQQSGVRDELSNIAKGGALALRVELLGALFSRMLGSEAPQDFGALAERRELLDGWALTQRAEAFAAAWRQAPDSDSSSQPPSALIESQGRALQAMARAGIAEEDRAPQWMDLLLDGKKTEMSAARVNAVLLQWGQSLSLRDEWPQWIKAIKKAAKGAPGSNWHEVGDIAEAWGEQREIIMNMRVVSRSSNPSPGAVAARRARAV